MKLCARRHRNCTGSWCRCTSTARGRSRSRHHRRGRKRGRSRNRWFGSRRNGPAVPRFRPLPPPFPRDREPGRTTAIRYPVEEEKRVMPHQTVDPTPVAGELPPSIFGRRCRGLTLRTRYRTWLLCPFVKWTDLTPLTFPGSGPERKCTRPSPEVGAVPYAGGVKAGSPGCEPTPGRQRFWNSNPGRG